MITDTQVSAKSENLLYIVVADPRNINDIRIRLAECRDPELVSMDFIPPPQYYERYSALAKYAQELRSDNKSIKTQIIFGKSDLELMTKTRGTGNRYETIPMEEIERKTNLPKYDHTIKWTRKQERPLRRRLSPTKEKPQLPSMKSVNEGNRQRNPAIPAKKVRTSDDASNVNNAESTSTKDIEMEDEDL